ncbi:hypothetical protein FOZ62_019918, partial [Perkinsus olseni]
MTHFVVRILLIIGLVVATPDDYSEPVGVEEFRASIMREGAAMSPYQFNDNFIVTGLRGSEGHLLPGPVKKACKAIAFVWIFCWPTGLLHTSNPTEPPNCTFNLPIDWVKVK